MGFKRHTLRIVAMLLEVVFSSVGLGWALFASQLHLAIVLLLFILTGIFLLFKLLTRTQNEILFFFKALENRPVQEAVQLHAAKEAGKISFFQMRRIMYGENLWETLLIPIMKR